MSSRMRSLSRTLIAVTAATAPVVALAPTASAAPSPQVPRLPQGFAPATPSMPAAPVRVLPTVEHTSVTRWVSVPVANVRSGPSTSYSIVGTKTQGAPVSGTLTSNGWLKISASQFMAPSVLTTTDPSASSTSTAGQSVTMYMAADIGNVRSGPGLTHAVVGTMTKGARVTGTWTSNGWLKVASDRYVSGTILTSSTTSTSTPQTSETVSRWVSVPSANVRRGPSTSYAVVGTKAAGVEVRGTIVSNGWLKISDTQYMAPSVLTSTRPADSSGSSTSTEVTQYLTATVGNVRSGPGLNHPVVGTMTLGTKVTGTWTSNGWLDLGDGRFVSGLILSSSDPAPAAPPAVQVVDRWVSAAVANVRSGPSTSYSIVGTRTQGTKVTGELTSNGWLKMSSTEYMSPGVLTTTPPTTTSPAPAPAPAPPAPTPLRQALLDTAALYVGYPYVLYGTPPEAFDCSAYTWWVFKENGISIPRTVRDQRTFVTPVTDPQPGDLIFYKNYYHVGIYAGNGMTYEAQNPQAGVVYGKIWDRPENVWYGRVPGV
jgi:peptidoglycan DL-endopeptidase CwlO